MRPKKFPEQQAQRNQAADEEDEFDPANHGGSMCRAGPPARPSAVPGRRAGTTRALIIFRQIHSRIQSCHLVVPIEHQSRARTELAWPALLSPAVISVYIRI